jgi:glucose/arabinose dehydrogenase
MVLLSNNFAIVALLGLASAAPELKKRACPAVAPQVKPVMSGGYTATVVAKGFKTPREMVFDPSGNMLVINQGGGGLSRITWTDNGGLDVCSSSIKTLVNDATVCAFSHLDWRLSRIFKPYKKKLHILGPTQCVKGILILLKLLK